MSGLWGAGDRLKKDSPVFEALGTLDELVSFLGIVKTQEESQKHLIGERKLYEILEEIQNHLFIIQAELAGSQKKLGSEKVMWLEEGITKIEKNIPPIKSFFLPGGVEIAALLDYARTIARKTERRIIALSVNSQVSDTIKQYINRLSSLLYTLARFVNVKEGKEEKPPTY